MSTRSILTLLLVIAIVPVSVEAAERSPHRLTAREARDFLNAKPLEIQLSPNAGSYSGPSLAVVYEVSSQFERREPINTAQDAVPSVDNGDYISNAPQIRGSIDPPDPRVAFVTGTNESGSYFCSGALIGPRHVLTAGHCVHRGNGGGFLRDVKVAFGYSNGSVLYGPYRAGKLITFSGWADAKDNAHDVALILLEHIVPPTMRFPYGLQAIDPGCRPLFDIGLPFFRPHHSIDWEAGRQQSSLYGEFDGCHAGTISTPFRTGHGSSGSPAIDPVGQFIFSVHSAASIHLGFDALLTKAKVCYLHEIVTGGVPSRCLSGHAPSN